MPQEKLLRKAITFHRQNNFNEARQIYQTILANNPDNLIALINLGSILKHLGDHEGALIHLRRASAKAPQNPDAHYNMGNAIWIFSVLRLLKVNYPDVL
jgi:tetratricopeptide (TPR) repeat protein